MKIATITCHNVYNYGASLQAYALQRYLSQEGHDVEIIDYKPYYLNSRYNWRHIPAESRLYPYKDYVGTQCIYFLLKNRKIYKTIGRKRKFDDFRQKYYQIAEWYQGRHMKFLAENIAADKYRTDVVCHHKQYFGFLIF